MSLLPLRPLRYVIPAAGAMLSTLTGVAAYAAHVANRPLRRTVRDDFAFSPWELQIPHESVSFRTSDGVRIQGWWFPVEDSNTVVVGCTGHRGSKHDLLGIGSGLWRADNNVLLFDFRGCGESDLVPLSLAHRELPDARAAIAFARSRLPSGRIGLVGYSMGAAVALMVAADDPTIRAVVADSSFASARDVIAQAFRRHGLPTTFLAILTDILNRIWYGYRFQSIRPIDSVGQISPRPLLIIHGGMDTITPVDQALQLYAAAAQPKELWIVEQAGHCGAYFADRQHYVDKVASFFAIAL